MSGRPDLVLDPCLLKPDALRDGEVACQAGQNDYPDMAQATTKDFGHEGCVDETELLQWRRTLRRKRQKHKQMLYV
jgi:hypothetical protein